MILEYRNTAVHHMNDTMRHKIGNIDGCSFLQIKSCNYKKKRKKIRWYGHMMGRCFCAKGDSVHVDDCKDTDS